MLEYFRSKKRKSEAKYKKPKKDTKERCVGTEGIINKIFKQEYTNTIQFQQVSVSHVLKKIAEYLPIVINLISTKLNIAILRS